MPFIILMSLVTTAIAGSAGFFSIYGLAQIFSGTFWAVVVMGISLEAGKLMTASFLYRYWNTINIALKSYMCVAVLILMAITSVGVFGFLSKAYQTDSLPMKEMEVRIASLEQEKTRISLRKTDMDTQLSKVDPSDGRGRLRLQKEFAYERETINQRLPVVEKELSTLKEKLLTTQLHVGPITYIAAAFGQRVDDSIKYMILLLIIAFDPLAIAMTLGINIAIREHVKNKANVASTPSLLTLLKPDVNLAQNVTQPKPSKVDLSDMTVQSPPMAIVHSEAPIEEQVIQPPTPAPVEVGNKPPDVLPHWAFDVEPTVFTKQPIPKIDLTGISLLENVDGMIMSSSIKNNSRMAFLKRLRSSD